MVASAEVAWIEVQFRGWFAMGALVVVVGALFAILFLVVRRGLKAQFGPLMLSAEKIDAINTQVNGVAPGTLTLPQRMTRLERATERIEATQVKEHRNADEFRKYVVGQLGPPERKR